MRRRQAPEVRSATVDARGPPARWRQSGEARSPQPPSPLQTPKSKLETFFLCRLICTARSTAQPSISVLEIRVTGADGENRTPTPLPEPDFESGASTNSATSAMRSIRRLTCRTHLTRHKSHIWLPERARIILNSPGRSTEGRVIPPHKGCPVAAVFKFPYYWFDLKSL